MANDDSLKIKDDSLIVRIEGTAEERDIILKHKNHHDGNRDTKLGDFLEELPAGKVYKDETGLGTTTLELKSNRHSIIVEPLKITASSKAAYHSKSHEEALYVGSKTAYNDYATDNRILTYFNNKHIKWKKIVVVADSL